MKLTKLSSCAGLLWSLVILEQAQAEILSLDITEGRSMEATHAEVRESWNEAAFSQAMPHRLPIADISVHEMKERGVVDKVLSIAPYQIQAHSVEVEYRGTETVVDKDDLPQIGVPTITAAGTRGAYFSSSRLIPMDARLTYPYSASGKLFFEDGNSRFICSGSVIDSRLVVTAGHCVHSGSGGTRGFYRNFIFIPAWHEGDAPFGVWSATWVTTTASWAGSNGRVPNAADFAVIEVADQEIDGELSKIGDVVGTYGFKTSALVSNHVKMIGYPGSFDDGNIMHQVDSGDSAAAQNNTVLYGSDMTGGSSGGPWIQNFGEPADGQPNANDGEFNTIVGITSYGFVSTEPKVQGSSILNDEFVEIYEAGCARDAENCE